MEQPSSKKMNSKHLFSSTLTFSEDTENNSTCTQSFVADPLQIPPKPLSHIASEYSHCSNHKSLASSYSKARVGPTAMVNLQSEAAITNYQNIQRILKAENDNLNKHNQLLLAEICKLKHSNRKYKKLYETERVNLQQAKEECEAQRQRAQEMKDIIFNRLAVLEEKIHGPEDSNSVASLLDALNNSQQ